MGLGEDATMVRFATAASSADRVPVIAVTGHLGAGKTSLLNHLLRRRGARLGVVVNDFGDINVDAALVAGQVDRASSVAGGCLCCMPRSAGLDRALSDLTRPGMDLDAIVVEASGVADPPALARLIASSSVPGVRMGGVIEVVDAVNVDRTVDTDPEPPRRYATATLVAVTKIDLLGDPDRQDEELDRIRKRVARINPMAQVVRAPHGRLDPDLVLDVADHARIQEELPLEPEDPQGTGEHAHEGHEHHEHVRSASVALPGPVGPAALVNLLEAPPQGAYRLKGRVGVRTRGGVRGYLVNLVGPLVHIARLPRPPEPVGELVAIGMDLDLEATQSALAGVAGSPGGPVDPAGLARLERYRRLSG